MTGFKQELTPSISQPGTSWFNDGVLDRTVLLGPKDGANLCSEDGVLENFLTVGLSGVTLTWQAVSGATNYVVQWANNSSFRGPTLRSQLVSTTYLQLTWGQEIRLCDTVYWRVMAYSTTGNMSPKSETWSFTFDCPEINSNAENFTIECSAFNVDIQISGPDLVKKGDQGLYHTVVNWNKNTKQGGLVELVSEEWELKQDGDSAEILCVDDGLLILDIDDSTESSEVITLTLKVNFTYTDESSTVYEFYCEKTKDITLDAQTSLPKVLRHGKIDRILGGNLYVVRFVDRVFNPDVDDMISEDIFSSSGEETGCNIEWLEAEYVIPKYAIVGDVKCRETSSGYSIPVGTDVVIGKIAAPTYSGVVGEEGSESSESFEACPDAEEQDYWWILEADLGATSNDLIVGMVSCYLGNGWYEMYKVDMGPPELPANEIVDETTGQTRIIQPWAGKTTFKLTGLVGPNGEWTIVDFDGVGTAQTPDARDYPGIEINDVLVIDNQLSVGQNYGLCIPECYASHCTWTWTQGEGSEEDYWKYAPSADCETEQGGDDPYAPGMYVHGGCGCQEPTGSGTNYGDTVKSACAAIDCPSPNQATWQWQATPPTDHFGTFDPYWKLISLCGEESSSSGQGPDLPLCQAVPPLEDGTSHLQTEQIECYPVGLCSWVTEMYDPISLCCDESLLPDPDFVPRQTPHTDPDTNASPNTYGETILAFSIDKMTQPGSFDLSAEPGTFAFLTPLKSGQFDPTLDKETNWAVVQWQRKLVKLVIPNSIQCCPLEGGGTEIKITSWSNVIVEGVHCDNTTDRCD